jgi:RHS repeat-associated protein
VDTVDINGRVYTYRYDAATSDWLITTPEGRQSTVQVDDQARAVGVTVPGLAPMTMSYDDEGRLTGWSVSDGKETRSFSLSYSEQDGLLQQSVEPFGAITFSRNVRGDITQMELPGGRSFQMDVDETSNVVQLNPPDTEAYTFEYNGMDQWLTIRNPDGARGEQPARSYTYDADSFLQQVQMASGDAITMQYEAGKARKSAITLPNGSYNFTYDTVGTNPTGQLRTVTSPDGVITTLTYEGFLPGSSTWTGEGVVGSVVRSYSQDFQLSRLTLDGLTYLYRYDQDGNLTQVGNMVLNRDAASGFFTGSTLQIDTGSIHDNWTMNAFGEYDAYAAQHNVAGVQYQHSVLQRNTIGWIESLERSQLGVTQTHNFSYDAAGNLVEEQINGTPILEFTYDTAGNRYPASGTAVYNQQDQLLQWNDLTFTYSPNGTMTSRTHFPTSEVTTYEHDLLGNLKQVVLPSGDRINYKLDGFNRRVAKLSNDQRVMTYLYQDQLNPVMTIDENDVKTRYIYAIHPYVPSFMVRQGEVYRLIFDHVGSVRLVVKVDDGSVAQAKTYDAFGNVLSDTNPGFQIFGFAGGIEDTDTHLVHFGRRDYDPQIGPFISQDPLHFKGGEYNLYTYARNNPVNFFDPGGTTTKGISDFLGRATGSTGHPSGGMTAVFKWAFSNTGKLVGGIMSTHNVNYGQTQCYKDQVIQNTKNLVGDLGQMGVTELIDYTPWSWAMPNNGIKQGFTELSNSMKDHMTGANDAGTATDAQAQQDHMNAFRDMINFVE